MQPSYIQELVVSATESSKNATFGKKSCISFAHIKKNEYLRQAAAKAPFR